MVQRVKWVQQEMMLWVALDALDLLDQVDLQEIMGQLVKRVQRDAQDLLDPQDQQEIMVQPVKPVILVTKVKPVQSYLEIIK
jgi:hypothetical protein